MASSLKFWPRAWSLRATFILMMAGSALLVTITAATLIWSMSIANDRLEKSANAQVRLELLFQLSGRVSDYGIVVLDLVRNKAGDTDKLASAKTSVNQVFERLDMTLADQIKPLQNDNDQAQLATKGLTFARLHALFNGLGRQVDPMFKGKSVEDDELSGQVQTSIRVFGIQFAQQLSHAIEDERKTILGVRSQMSALRSQITSFAIGLIVLAVVSCVSMYFLLGRSILSRINKTLKGTQALTMGDFDRRLEPQGNDELTLLMTQFNHMAEEVGKREAALLESQDKLQETIDVRTQDLKQSNERLENIDNQRKRFFSDVSHELRTPLTVILGESQLALKSADKLNEHTVSVMQTINDRGESLRRRVDDLLRVARSESGQLDLDFRQLNMNDIVAQAVEETYLFAEKYDMEVRVEYGSSPLMVNGDQEWLRQVFSGLLVNAVRYSKNGMPLMIDVNQDAGNAKVSITDHGAGISKADRPHLFERFYRGETAQEKTQKRGDRGFGIGLSIIKWVLDEHGGRIEVETNDGIDPTPNAPKNEGTQMIVTVPLISSETGKAGS